MSTDVIDFAERRYRALIGKRCTLALSDGSTSTGKVLRGLYFGTSGSSKARFRLRARSTIYVLLSAAVRLRPAPMKKRPARRYRGRR
jgi:hypothetical protein